MIVELNLLNKLLTDRMFDASPVISVDISHGIIATLWKADITLADGTTIMLSIDKSVWFRLTYQMQHYYLATEIVKVLRA